MSNSRINLLEDLETQYEIDKLDLVQERSVIREALVSQLATCWKAAVVKLPPGAEKTRWTGVFGSVLKEFSEQLIYNLDDEDYATLAFKKRLSMSLEGVLSKLLPSVQSFTDVYKHMDTSGADLGDSIHIQKLRERVDRELEEDEPVEVPRPKGRAPGRPKAAPKPTNNNGKRHIIDDDYSTDSSLSPPPPVRRKRRTREEMERDRAPVVEQHRGPGRAPPSFHWTTANQIKLKPINSKSPTLCQGVYSWYTDETISGRSVRSMVKSRYEQDWLSKDTRSQDLLPKYMQIITRMESIHKHILKEYAMLPVGQKNARAKESMRQDVLVLYYDKVLMADEELLAEFMADKPHGALAIIARAVLDLYMTDFKDGVYET